MTVLVKELTQSCDQEVVAFLDSLGQQSPSVLGYHYPFYREMLVALDVGTPLYLGAYLGGSLVGVLPVFVRKSEMGIVYGSLPFFGPNAGVLCGPGPDRLKVHSALLGYTLDRARQDKALSCSVYTPLLFDEFSIYDSFGPDATIEKSTLYTDIQSVQWSSKIQYDLRRTRRLGVTVSSEPSPRLIDKFYTIYSQNCSDYSIPIKPRRCIEFLVDSAVLGQHSQVYFAMHNEDMIGGLLIVRSPTTASYYVPCTLHEARTLQPGSMLIDKAVEEMRAVGVRIWNWESSPSHESGVYQYKKKWNSIEAAYRIYTWCPSGLEPLQEAGQERLASEFPHFFVYPFDRL